MRRRCSLKEQAHSFSENFDKADRGAVEEWYHEKLRGAARARMWLWVRAAIMVALFVLVLPATALWVMMYFR